MSQLEISSEPLNRFQRLYHISYIGEQKTPGPRIAFFSPVLAVSRRPSALKDGLVPYMVVKKNANPGKRDLRVRPLLELDKA